MKAFGIRFDVLVYGNVSVNGHREGPCPVSSPDPAGWDLPPLRTPSSWTPRLSPGLPPPTVPSPSRWSLHTGRQVQHHPHHHQLGGSLHFRGRGELPSGPLGGGGAQPPCLLPGNPGATTSRARCLPTPPAHVRAPREQSPCVSLGSWGRDSAVSIGWRRPSLRRGPPGPGWSPAGQEGTLPGSCSSPTEPFLLWSWGPPGAGQVPTKCPPQTWP